METTFVNTATGSIWLDAILFIAGICIALWIVHWLFYLPEKNAKVGAWLFKTAVQAMDDAHELGRIPAPGTKGTYGACQRYAAEYMERNGILACEVQKGSKVIQVDYRRMVEAQRPAVERVTDILAKMEYTQPQIDRIMHKAEVMHGKGIRSNFDELLWFTLKTAEEV